MDFSDLKSRFMDFKPGFRDFRSDLNDYSNFREHRDFKVLDLRGFRSHFRTFLHRISELV